MASSAPTGDFACLVCGALGGHGNLPCPNLTYGPQVPAYNFGPDYLLHSKLDRIIDLLQRLVSRESP